MKGPSYVSRPVVLTAVVFTLCLCAGTAPAQEAPEPDIETYYLVNNFSVPLPSTAVITAGIDEEDKVAGLASARLAYRFDPAARLTRGDVRLEAEMYTVDTPGTVRFWVKGDGSGNRLSLDFSSGTVARDKVRGRYMAGTKRDGTTTITLDFEEWKEFSVDLSEVKRGRVIWWSGYTLTYAGKGEEGRPEGEVKIDEMRVLPASGKAPSVTYLKLAGSRIRAYDPDLYYSLDLRNFEEEAFRAIVRLTMTDRNENLVAERDFELPVAGFGSGELKLELEPENLPLFLPPFRFKGELYCPDRPSLSATVDEQLVMGNSYLLFDDFGDVFGRWFLSGQPPNPRENNAIFGEQQHADARVQTAARISRVDVKPDAAGTTPPGRYAMQIDFEGRAAVYNGLKRYLPGDAYRMGVWVKGDGSGAILDAIVLDFAAPGGTFYTWKRSFANIEICRLDFTGWQYFEVPLPGNGIGPRTPRGSTEAIDFPLDLSAFLVTPAGKTAQNPEPRTSGSFQVGPIFLHTQHAGTDALSVHVAYDDPNHEYASGRGAWVSVQNGWRPGDRSLNVTWSLLDRGGDVVARGRKSVTLAPLKTDTFRVDLAKEAAKIAARNGPFRLHAVVSDARAAGTAEASIVLSRPDSEVHLADFETDRGYLGLKAIGAPAPATPAARTVTTQKRGGQRSLAMPWKKGGSIYVSVDPAVPGVPTEISLWVHGDKSGAWFFPLIGDRFGVVSGIEQCQWDLFLPRTTSGPLQNAVVVDWNGWKKLTFRLPPIPASWNDASRVLPFVPTYPLGIHLAVVAPNSLSAASGTLFVDDITLKTHLEESDRVGMTLERLGDSNLVVPGANVRVTVANMGDKAAGAKTRSVRLAGGIFDWKDERVTGIDKNLSLAPGARQSHVLAANVRPGAYEIRAELHEGTNVVASVAEDLVAMNAPAVLGQAWQGALSDENKIRSPVGDRFTKIKYDWDWVEYQPGNLQVEPLLRVVRDVQNRQQDAFVPLGFTTYWASGSGYEDLLAGQLSARGGRADSGFRDWGHAVDIFHTPERMEDWDNYTREMMRYAGDQVDGWLLWDSPDSTSSLGVEPSTFAEMAKIADGWRELYCPNTPILVGGLSRNSAITYLVELGEEGALDHIGGVNLRIDAGRISPEDGQVLEYLEDLRSALRGEGRTARRILVTDLDWAVEKEGRGLDAFDQAAYLVRAALLLDLAGAEHALMIRNESSARLGFGLTYTKILEIPPMREKMPAYYLKPAWWAMHKTRVLMAGHDGAAEVDVQDTVPGATRCIVYRRKADGKPVAVVWRNDAAGQVSFAATGYSVTAAAGILGETVKGEGGWYEVGKMPAVFVLTATGEAPAQALRRLHVRDKGQAPAWSQHTLAAFTPDQGARQKYAQTGGKAAPLTGRFWTGREMSRKGIVFEGQGTERFEIAVPKGHGFVLKKRFYLDGKGHSCEVLVNGKSLGAWDLTRSQEELSSGMREAGFLVPASAAGSGTAAVEIRYAGPANTAEWIALAYKGGAFPLSALGPVHADSNVAVPRVARNVVGLPLKVGNETFANGLGVFARSFIEYSLAGQFKRFTARVGVDAATEGRGSVMFEVWTDGKKAWSSPVISGLDRIRDVEVDVSGVDRLRLLVNDGGDGNKFDAADWCEPVLWLE